MDAYDLPEELSMLQSQDMSRIGFMQDIIHGVKKMLEADAVAKASSATNNIQGSASVDAFMKRANIFLNDSEWEQADAYFNKALDLNPEHAPAYVGKLCVEFGLHEQTELRELEECFSASNNYKNALRFASSPLKESLLYEEATWLFDRRCFSEAEALFLQISGYQDADEMANNCVSRQNEWEERRKKCAEAPKKFTILDNDIIVNNPDGTILVYKYQYSTNSDKHEILFMWKDIVAVSGLNGLKSDGTVISVFADSRISAWRDIVAISGSVGLKSDGTVVNASKEIEGVSKWSDIIAISATDKYAAGLKSDGTIVTNRNTDIDNFNNVIAVHVTDWHIIGLKADGTVVATDHYHACGLIDTELSTWEKKTAVDVAKNVRKGKENILGYTFGLDVSGWNDIVAIGGVRNIAFGIRSDGTVVVADSMGNKDRNQKQAFVNQDVVACGITRSSADEIVLFGIKSDGAVVISEEYASVFTLRTPQEAEKERNQKIAWARKGLCTDCGGVLKGLFTKVCKSCGEESDGGLLDRLEKFTDNFGERIEDSSENLVDRFSDYLDRKK